MIKNILLSIDGIGNKFIATVYKGLSGQLGTTLKMLLTLYVMYEFYKMMKGNNKEPLMHCFERMTKAIIVICLVKRWDLYSMYVVQPLIHGPTAISDLVINAVSENGTGAIDSLSNYYDTTSELVTKIAAQGGFTNIMAAILAGIVMCFGVLFCGIAVAALTIIKITLWILLSIGAIFSICMLFGYTVKYTSGWIDTMVSLGIQVVVIYAILGLTIFLSSDIIKALNETASKNQTPDLKQIAPYLLITAVGGMMFVVAPFITAQITGKFMAPRTPSPGQVGRGAVATARGVYRTGRFFLGKSSGKGK